jgi:chemotaxis protein CheC
VSASLLSWCDDIPESELGEVLQAAMHGAARGLSGLARHPIHVTTLRLETVPIAQVATHAGDPETEVVGIYLVMEGDCSGQAILMLSLASALNLADALLNVTPGTSTHLGEMERSALAEAGNLMVSYFLNAVATFLKRPRLLQPSPPAVMVDMLGAVLDEVMTPVAVVSDDLTIAEAAFAQGASTDGGSDRTIQVHFWVLPDAAQIRQASGRSAKSEHPH